jgi:hypothetical protein
MKMDGDSHSASIIAIDATDVLGALTVLAAFSIF